MATQQTDRPPELQNRFATGFTVAGGLQFGLPVIRVSPEIRYIRWGWENFRNPATAFRNNQDEVLFLVGVTF